MSEIAELIESTGAIKRGKFKLSDGSLTDYYIDKYSFETTPEVLETITEAIASELDGSEIDLVAGPALGAVPLVTAVSLRTGLPAAFVRMGDKYRGTQARVEGEIDKGQRVAVLEDVTTTGGTILESADVVEELGATVERLVVVVDRNEGAIERAREDGRELEHLTQIGENLEIE